MWIFKGQETTVRTQHGTMDWFRIGKGVWQGCSYNSLFYLYEECVLSSFSCVQLLVTPWTVAHQAPPSMGFSRQEYWSGVPCPSPGDLPDPGIEPGSPAAPARQAGSSLLNHRESPICRVHYGKRWAGWVRNWNQDCLEKYQQPQICRWYHANGRKWKELKSLLMKVKESEKVGLKLNIQKTKIMVSGSITLWQIEGEKVKIVTDFILLGSKITADCDCSHEIKRCLFLGRKLWQS